MNKSVALLLLCLCSFAFAQQHTAAPNSTTLTSALPIYFEQNLGQAPKEYLYIARGGGAQTMLLREGADVFVPNQNGGRSLIQFRLVGASIDSLPVATDQLPGTSNYLRGRDASRWVRGARQYGRVRYTNVYPGTDLVFHGDLQELEHDFELAPHADASKIAFKLSGADKLNIDEGGRLVAKLDGGELVFNKPVAYQKKGAVQESVDAQFKLTADGTVRFQLGHYDHSRTLVIDPTLVFSSYVAGSDHDDITGVMTDSSGNIYITGATKSVDFPTVNGAQPVCASCSSPGQPSDAFVMKIDPTGHSILYSTFLGGDRDESGVSIAVTLDGRVVVAGWSTSTDFPIAGTVDFVVSGFPGNFLTSLSSDGSSLIYSGLVHGGVAAVAVDNLGNAYLAGETTGPFILTPGTVGPTLPDGYVESMFVMKVDPTGKLVYSTLIPGTLPRNQNDDMQSHFIPFGIGVDANGRVTVGGNGGLGLPTTPEVLSPQFPKEIVYGRNQTGFLLQLNADASAIQYATYLPGTDSVAKLARDPNGNSFVTGYTQQTNLPVSPTAYIKTYPGDWSGYVLKIDAFGKTAPAGTYLPAQMVPRVLAVDSHSRPLISVIGRFEWPLRNPLIAHVSPQLVFDGPTSLLQFESDLSAIVFGTLWNARDVFGGVTPTALAFDSEDRAVLVGRVSSRLYPTTPSSFKPEIPPEPNPYNTHSHGFVAKFDLQAAAPSLCFDRWSLTLAPPIRSTDTQTATLTNCGNADLQIDSLVAPDATMTATHNCGHVSPGASCSIQVTYSPIDASFIDGEMAIHSNAVISPQYLQVAGRGIFGMLVPVISGTAFGKQLVNTTSLEVANISISNLGTADLFLQPASISADFVLVYNSCGALLPIRQGCSLNVAFSPTSAGLKTGTVTIFSTDPINPEFQIPLSGTGVVADPVPSVTYLNPSVLNPQLTGKIAVFGTNFMPNSVVRINGRDQLTTYVSDTQLTATLEASFADRPLEAPVTVVNHAPGGESNALPLTMYKQLANPYQGVVSAPTRKMIYAATPNYTYTPNQLIPIDAETGVKGTPITLAGTATSMAVSDDGHKLYAAVSNSSLQKTQRIDLDTMTIDKEYEIYGTVHAFPGSPDRFAVSTGGRLGVADGNGIIDVVPPQEDVTFLRPVREFTFYDATTMYSLPFLDIASPFFRWITFDSQGLRMALENSLLLDGSVPVPLAVVSDGRFLYTDDGKIWDPASKTLAGTFDDFNLDLGDIRRSIAVDRAARSVYRAGSTPRVLPGTTTKFLSLTSYDTASLKNTGRLIFPNSTGPADVPNLSKWASDGYAFVASTGLYIVRSNIGATGLANPAPELTSISPAEVKAGSSAFTLNVTGSGFITSSTVTWNGAARPTTFVSSTQLTAEIPETDLMPGGSGAGEIRVVNPVPAGGVSVAFNVSVNDSVPVLSVSSRSLTYASLQVGQSSVAQHLTVANLGRANLAISSVSASGDFIVTHNCVHALSQYSGCEVNITYKPTASGTRTGAITIVDNTPASPHVVNLSGAATDPPVATIGIAPGSSNSATVTKGQTATYQLVVGGSGLTGALNFTCTGAPSYSNCLVSPGSATVPNGGTVNLTVSVTTQAGSSAAVSGNNSLALAGVGILPLLALGLLAGGRRKVPLLLTVSFAGVLALASCGGGGGGGGTVPPPVQPGTPSGTYTLTVTATGSANASQSLTLKVQ